MYALPDLPVFGCSGAPLRPLQEEEEEGMGSEPEREEKTKKEWWSSMENDYIVRFYVIELALPISCLYQILMTNTSTTPEQMCCDLWGYLYGGRGIDQEIDIGIVVDVDTDMEIDICINTVFKPLYCTVSPAYSVLRHWLRRTSNIKPFLICIFQGLPFKLTDLFYLFKFFVRKK